MTNRSYLRALLCREDNHERCQGLVEVDMGLPTQPCSCECHTPKPQLGAIDISYCPTKRETPCRCGPCEACGFGPHMAIHGPVFGQPPGSRPWGHMYQAREPEEGANG